jgi:hypothetical protein
LRQFIEPRDCLALTGSPVGVGEELASNYERVNKVKTATHNLDTTGWDSYSFEYDGKQFVSLISPTSEFSKQMKNLPIQVITEMNHDCLRQYLGSGKTITEIEEILVTLNENASHAIIDLA